MKKLCNFNRGATLIELITSIAILSIVGVSCFTLLMFSIRTNNFILTGTNACRDAELINDRLELAFEDKEIFIESASNEGVFSNITFTINSEDSGLSFEWNGSTLSYLDETIQQNITGFNYEIIENTNLLRITYTIDDSYTSTKIFKCKRCQVLSP